RDLRESRYCAALYGCGLRLTERQNGARLGTFTARCLNLHQRPDPSPANFRGERGSPVRAQENRACGVKSALRTASLAGDTPRSMKHTARILPRSAGEVTPKAAEGAREMPLEEVCGENKTSEMPRSVTPPPPCFAWSP